MDTAQGFTSKVKTVFDAAERSALEDNLMTMLVRNKEHICRVCQDTEEEARKQRKTKKP